MKTTEDNFHSYQGPISASTQSDSSGFHELRTAGDLPKEKALAKTLSCATCTDDGI